MESLTEKEKKEFEELYKEIMSDPSTDLNYLNFKEYLKNLNTEERPE